MTLFTPSSSQDIEQLVEKRFKEGGVNPISIDKRAYPEETIFVVRVSPDDHSAAQNIGNLLDRELAKSDFKGFVTVRRQEPDASSTDVLPKGIACGRPIATTI